jgi:hypothetical protein
MSVMFLKHWVRTSDAGMSVENVPAVVNIKKRKGRFIGHTFSTGWAVDVLKSVENRKVLLTSLQSSKSR